MSPSLANGHVGDCFGHESVVGRCYEALRLGQKKPGGRTGALGGLSCCAGSPALRSQAAPEATVPGGLRLQPSLPRCGPDSEAAFPLNTREWPPGPPHHTEESLCRALPKLLAMKPDP